MSPSRSQPFGQPCDKKDTTEVHINVPTELIRPTCTWLQHYQSVFGYIITCRSNIRLNKTGVLSSCSVFSVFRVNRNYRVPITKISLQWTVQIHRLPVYGKKVVQTGRFQCKKMRYMVHGSKNKSQQLHRGIIYGLEGRTDIDKSNNTKYPKRHLPLLWSYFTHVLADMFHCISSQEFNTYCRSYLRTYSISPVTVITIEMIRYTCRSPYVSS